MENQCIIEICEIACEPVCKTVCAMDPAKTCCDSICPLCEGK